MRAKQLEEDYQSEGCIFDWLLAWTSREHRAVRARFLSVVSIRKALAVPGDYFRRRIEPRSLAAVGLLVAVGVVSVLRRTMECSLR